jgi:hypothetical protein
MPRIKPLVTTLAITGTLIGGGAAIASAATPNSTTTSSHTGTTSSGTGTSRPSAPAHGQGGSATHHNCPGM